MPATTRRRKSPPATAARPKSADTHAAAGADVLERVRALAHNLWWVWNPRAERLMESLDPALWEATGHSPLRTLQGLEPHRREALRSDADFAGAVAEVEADLHDYLRAPTWFHRSASPDQRKMLTAYFCMEYAIHESLPLYAGGLGVLAGDHVRSASDLGVPLVCVGVLWRCGYYRQEIMADGGIRVLYPHADYGLLPITDTRKTFTMRIGDSDVRVKIWTLKVGRIDILLLDTDVPQNSQSDRELTWYLYGGGSHEYRVRQEMLLGVGGLMALDAMKLKPTVYHLNEGHAAFCPLERVRRLVTKGASITDAAARVRSASVFTTHTPVPEGNDRFDPALVLKYLKPVRQDLGLSEQELLALGREDPGDAKEPFCMTVLALKLSERCNGVAALHGETSRRMWMKTFGAASPDQVPIHHVTNGIHPETWIAPEARAFYDTHLKPQWLGAGPDDDWWKRIEKVNDAEFWALRHALRRKMVAELRRRLRAQLVQHSDDPALIDELYERLDENALTIGFARRFALYKRAPLIFSDPKRLARLIDSADRPVQIVFAGKAHPLDKAGHEYTTLVHRFTRQAPFRGRVFILQNYDMAIGRLLTQGCDVWLNNPLRPQEASGTSGMKPALNGGINCSILDGWWPEAFDGTNGWQIGDAKQFKDRARQDRHDAASLYRVLEDEVVPMFYARGKDGVPRKWVKMMKRSMATIGAAFSAHRMVGEYVNWGYLPAHEDATGR